MTGIGAFASEVIAKPPRSDQVFRIPDAMGWDEAAALNLTYGTAILAFRRGQLKAGESVLVLGAAGGTGSAAIQVAKAMGAFVIAAAGGAEKLAIAEQCGADAVLDYREEGLSTRVKELTGGNGVDVIFDPVGGSEFREYLRCLAWYGRYLVVGFAAGEIPSVGLNLILLKSISIVGVAYGASARLDPAANAENFEQLFAWYDAGLLHPVVGHHFPLEEGAEALRVVSNRGALGKVIIDIGG
jgi:NADPH2:quinone reductase